MIGNYFEIEVECEVHDISMLPLLPSEPISVIYGRLLWLRIYKMEIHGSSQIFISIIAFNTHLRHIRGSNRPLAYKMTWSYFIDCESCHVAFSEMDYIR